MKLTITEQHLDEAIEMEKNGGRDYNICRSCVVSVAAKEQLPGFRSSAGGRLNFGNYKKSTIVNFKLAIIMNNFDSKRYNLVRDKLPATFDLELQSN